MMKEIRLFFLYLLHHNFILGVIICYAMVYNLKTMAQCTKSLDATIHTPQIEIEGVWNTLPIIPLNGPSKITLSFDDFNEEAARYFYKIEHCDAHFQPTTHLFESNYLQATSNELLLETYEPSRNTLTPYYHYRLTLPNQDMKMLLSGNYKITIEREDEEGMKPVLETYFMVLERLCGVNLSVTTNTDIDYNQSHQQLTLEVDHSQLKLHNAPEQIECIVVKNRDWNNARWLMKPSMVMNGKIKWQHAKELIFNAGNEFRKFENLSTTIASLHTDRIEWDATSNSYNVVLYTDEPRSNYLYDEDQNGAFKIRNTDNHDDATESDYANVCFSLAMPQHEDACIYINGNWATNSNGETYRMHYNESTECYEANLLLKQGYYNYYYNSKNLDIEGDFYETENEYLVLVYATLPGERYTRLVGMGKIHSGNRK